MNIDLSPWGSIRKSLQILARQSEDVEAFSARTLQLIGELVGARSVVLHIQDLRRDTRVIYATMRRDGKNNWAMTVDDTDAYDQNIHSRRKRPKYILQSCFGFILDLPARWRGVILIEYPGIKIVTPEQHRILIQVLGELSDSLHVVLMNQEVKKLETLLRDRERVNQELRQNMTDMSKEAYCVSSVITGLTQSLNVSEIFTRILGDTLPLLKAKSGDVYFPQTDQCVSFKASGVLYELTEHDHHLSRRHSREHCLKEYFEKKYSQLKIQADGISFDLLPLDNPSFSPFLKKRFQSMDVQSIFEFSFCSGEEVFGIGLLGFSEDCVQADKSRLFKITLNMISLFLENISLMKSLEHQVKQKSNEILKMEKEQRFMFEHVSRPFSLSATDLTANSEQILEQIDHSQRAVFLGELASGVAHQIRNPLNHLVGVLHLIKNKDIAGDEDSGELLQEVTHRVETIHQMINKFIHYTRIPELNLTSESVNDVLKDSLQAFKGQMDQAKVTVSTSLDPGLSMTKLDLYLMDQVYHNIIKNAVEAMGQSGELSITTRKLEVKYGPNPRLEFVEILFQDTGAGIPKEDIDKVLTPFFSRKKDGIGLGLAIVNHVVGLHGGAVQVKNRKKGGTDVRICLPIR
ncbi:sensor histidine kinase [Desulfospira joergensenii]|uniref:sensor histidine kinase n=1 Tax=Desulfospira joergensenii TaxID=53329 RepID=UPI0003B3F399|nr:ATP-binding protein [Desulfospira joergensenii]